MVWTNNNEVDGINWIARTTHDDDKTSDFTE